jgi:DNA helicase-2/ATP-dependent DNA helicase PcrA
VSRRLNPDQQQVVLEPGHCLVLACPGSGKTTTVVAKTGVILSQSPDHHVCAISFTREGAKDVKKQLVKECGAELVSKRCRVGTFHSLAIKLLTSQQKLTRVLSPGEQAEYIRRTWRECGVGIAPETVQMIIEHNKSSLSTPEKPVTDSVTDGMVYDFYQSLLQRNKVMDLQDVLIQSSLLMRDGVLNPLPITHLLVDEYQDTDEVQFEFIYQHTKRGIITTAVADDDQSIYAWRNAMGYGGMERFKKMTGAAMLTLGINYRCRSEILSAADRLISNNKHRYEKNLVAARGEGGTVTVFRIPSRPDEASDVTNKVLVDATRGLRVGEWAVLARTNKLLDEVDALFSTKGIPFHRPGKSFWQKSPQILMIAFLRCLETAEKNGIDQILHWAGLSKEDLDKLHNGDADLSGLLSGKKKFDLSEYEPALKKVLKEFIEHIPAWRRDALKPNRRDIAVNGFCSWMRKAYACQIAATFSDKTKAKRRIEEAEDFIDIVWRAINQMDGTFKERERRLTEPKEEDPEGSVAKVMLTTYHGSKGLEYEKVWLIGANAVVTPGSSDIEEERRLFYVATTRAKDELYISSVMNIRGKSNDPSQFIEEAGLVR